MGLASSVAFDSSLLRRSTWLWPLDRAAAHLATFTDWPPREAFDAMYAACTQHLAPPEPLRFVANVRRRSRRRASAIDPEQLYDGRISRAREVPTRERDWHDLFNALCFATYPRAKLALHARQYRAMCERIAPGARSLPSARTREQDTLTLFDEGGVALVGASETCAELRGARADTLEDTVAALEREGRLRRMPFGHALYEHEVAGLPTRAGARLVELETLHEDEVALIRATDAALASLLACPTAFTSPAEHLPLQRHGERGPAVSTWGGTGAIGA